MEDIELHRNLIKQGVGGATELLVPSFQCLGTNIKGQNSHVKRASGAVTKHQEAKPSTHRGD